MEEAALSLNDEVLKAGERGMALCVPRGGGALTVPGVECCQYGLSNGTLAIRMAYMM